MQAIIISERCCHEMADNKIVVFDFTGVRFHDSHTGISSELLTVGYQYADAIEETVTLAESTLNWERDRDLRCIHFGRYAVLEAYIAGGNRWVTDWSSAASALRRFQAVLTELGVRSVKAYETAHWPPRFGCFDAPETNPLVPPAQKAGG